MGFYVSHAIFFGKSEIPNAIPPIQGAVKWTVE
jgi:hypothetical protein